MRQGTSTDWQSFVMPPVLYLNTLVLLASSCTIELSRRKFAVAVGQATGENTVESGGAMPWLYTTIVLGTIFVLGQWFAWKALAARGLFLATNPSSSFFYVLTAMHGLHLLGGMVGLLYVAHRLGRGAPSRQVSALGAASTYWHFMGVLWVFLFLVMAIRL